MHLLPFVSSGHQSTSFVSWSLSLIHFFVSRVVCFQPTVAQCAFCLAHQCPSQIDKKTKTKTTTSKRHSFSSQVNCHCVFTLLKWNPSFLSTTLPNPKWTPNSFLKQTIKNRKIQAWRELEAMTVRYWNVNSPSKPWFFLFIIFFQAFLQWLYKLIT